MNEQIKQKMKEFTENNLYMRDMNLNLLSYDDGYAKAEILVDEHMMNPYGSVHGGVLYAVADIVAGTAACSCGVFSSTIQGSMNYLKPGIGCKKIICESTVVRSGSSISVYDVKLEDEKKNLLATGTFTFYMMNRKVVE